MRFLLMMIVVIGFCSPIKAQIVPPVPVSEGIVFGSLPGVHDCDISGGGVLTGITCGIHTYVDVHAPSEFRLRCRRVDRTWNSSIRSFINVFQDIPLDEGGSYSPWSTPESDGSHDDLWDWDIGAPYNTGPYVLELYRRNLGASGGGVLVSQIEFTIHINSQGQWSTDPSGPWND